MKKSVILLGLLISFAISCRSMAYKCIDEDGCPNDKGRFISNNKHQDKYEGQMAVRPGLNLQFDPLLPHGFGKMIYGPQIPGTHRAHEEGEIFEGYWEWDRFNSPNYSGHGIFITPSGWKTEAEWSEDFVIKGTAGSRTFPDGKSISGIWDKNGYLCSGNCQDGEGIQTSSTGEWLLKGSFKEGFFTKGSYITPYFQKDGQYEKNKHVSGSITCKVDKTLCDKKLRYFFVYIEKLDSKIKVIYK